MFADMEGRDAVCVFRESHSARGDRTLIQHNFYTILHPWDTSAIYISTGYA